MDDDFEQRLRTMLLTDADPPPSERFDALVRARISSLRRMRQFVLPAAAVAATVIVAWLVAPWFTSGAAVVAESSLALNNTLGAWIVSPAGYVLGAAAAAAALIDSLRR
jgi:hypothetical protein